MKTLPTPKSLLVLFFILIHSIHLFSFVLGCNRDYTLDNEQKKDQIFGLTSGEDIRNQLKDQEVLADFRDKTKIHPIRITFDTTYLSEAHRNLNPLTHEQIIYVESILADTATFFQGFIKVLPHPSNIKFKRSYNTCSGKIIPENDIIEGIPNSDLHIYLMYTNSSDYLASAAYCQLGEEIGYIRPIFGTIRLSRLHLFEEDIKNSAAREEQFSTLLHEIIHILGFSKAQYKYFLDNDQLNFMEIRGLQTAVLSSPRVLKAAKNYYQCESLCGMQLENSGGLGSRNGHWEATILADELMTASHSVDQISLSVMTIKLLQDTRFYSEVNENYADEIFWGRNKGCEFVNSACQSNQKFPEFRYGHLANKYQQKCSFSSMGKGYIKKQSKYIDGKCSTIQAPHSEDQCTLSANNKNSNRHLKANKILPVQYFSPQSKCLLTKIYNSSQKSVDTNPMCLQYQCLGGVKQIKVFTRSANKNNQNFVLCGVKDAGKELVIETNEINQTFQVTVKCPNDFAHFCSKKQCLNGCSSNGFCLKGQCVCHPEYARPNCSKKCGLNRYAQKLMNSMGKFAYQCVKKCQNGNVINPDNTCKPKCPKSYFESEGKCQPCDFSCSSCSGPGSNQCTRCHFLSRLKQGICFENV